MSKLKNEKITILYERLSVDDGNGESESNSIQNQRRILEEYAVQNGLTPFVHHCEVKTCKLLQSQISLTTA